MNWVLFAGFGDVRLGELCARIEETSQNVRIPPLPQSPTPNPCPAPTDSQQKAKASVLQWLRTEFYQHLDEQGNIFSKSP